MGTKTIYSEDYRLLVQFLRTEREHKSMTQVALSDLIGWPQQRLSAIEAGSRRLDVIEFVQLTRALGIPDEQASERLFSQKKQQAKRVKVRRLP